MPHSNNITEYLNKTNIPISGNKICVDGVEYDITEAVNMTI